MSAEVEALQQFYAAINRNDLEAAVRDLDPEVIRVEPAGYPTAGTHRGIAAVRAQVGTGRGSWAEGSCDPERFLANGDKVVVYLHARVRLKESNEWVGGRFADGFVFRGGKIVEYITFWERPEALAWAGLEDPDA